MKAYFLIHTYTDTHISIIYQFNIFSVIVDGFLLVHSGIRRLLLLQMLKPKRIVNTKKFLESD